ncbi:MAG TPA: glycosyl hydrolase family 39 [Verrucomicrobiae bacterium]|nr:glycosyl hydrolase family 39 [Verrucomicrobiae bacterium]
MRKVSLLTFVTILLSMGVSVLLPPLGAQSSTETVIVDAAATSTPLSHFWEHMFGSGRAILSMRQSYRDDLRLMKQATGIQYVRFHAILDDEVGVYDEDAQGNPVFNFSYIDQIYDGLLANGVRPYVELSFMPHKLAAHVMVQAFWYKPDVSPPSDYAKWDALITQLAKHLIDRYGIDEASQWYFEVWNEPNLDFWGGVPKQSTYFELYDHTARALKAVNSRLRVGGPATAQAAWADAFIQHCAENKVPVDFVSSHVYGNDKSEDVFGTHEKIPRDQMVCRAVAKVHHQIKSSAMPDLPLIWSEFNASYMNETDVTDSAYMGPYLADTIRQCDGLVNEMSYWTFSDVFEEQGVIKKPFYGGYGAIAEDDIPKPAFNAFVLLHRLGEQRLAASSNDVLATRRSDGTLVIAAWNLVDPGTQGPEKEIELKFQHAKVSSLELRRVDPDHGDVKKAYEEMGSPRYPSKRQIEELRAAARLSSPETQEVKNNSVTLRVPAHGLVLVEVKPAE